ncbi:NACHT domain-containing protein [Streptomyces sp. Caat 7-52]|uniref:NACHT domain-containing protein n=1 Tax=Streptomyces sp. Caat 7-52 TaxID=2949637 RepID=UPI002035BF70|nr:NACHT domain-containing protein [Streptomyces sp. Caat 7-52]
MEPATTGTRLASAVVGPLVKKLFVTEGPGAGLVDKPVRLSGYVSFKGEKRRLTAPDLRGLAARLVEQALCSGEPPIADDEREAVTEALFRTLHALGGLTLTDLDAVRLGHQALARELRRAARHPERELSADAALFHERLLDTACLHILHFFTQRSTFVAHTLVEQTRALDSLTAKVDELVRRNPPAGGEDTAFEQAYLRHVAKKHGKLTIYGLDLDHTPRRWPLDVAYLSLEATAPQSPARTAARRLVEVLWADSDATPDAILTNLDSPAAHGGTDDGRGDEEMDTAWGRLPADRAVRLLRTASYRDAAAAADMVHGILDRLPSEAPDHRPADRALADSPRILLRGEAGSGKSTLVQWLAVTAARHDVPEHAAYLQDRIPFVLPLRTLTRHGEALPAPKDFLAAVGSPLAGSQPAGWEHRVLTAGRGLILVDGIDEVPDAERERTRTWLRDLAETYDGDNRWLVTSRPPAVAENWLAEDGFTELTLSPMSPADIATFVERWHRAARPGTDDDAGLDRYERQLLTAIRTKPDLGRLATNPLMCGLICALHRDRHGYLPQGRKDLYEAALSMLLSRRDRERDMAVPDLREEPQLDLLQRLAYWLIKNGRTEMDRSRAETIIDRALPAVPEAAALGDASAVFAYFLNRSGLLREPVPGTVDFIHRTFQDFLGARAAVEESDFGLLAGHAADDQWEDVIGMAVALGRPRERETIFQALLALGDKAPGKRTQARVYLLAAACLEHATSLAPSVREAVERRTATLIPPESPEQARALAEVGPLILGLLPEPEKLSDEAAFHVVVAASHVKSDAALPFLARFAGHPYQAVRAQLVWAWPRFDCTRYADEIITRLDPSGLDFTIQSDAQLRELDRLGLRPDRLDLRTGVSSAAVAAYTSRNRLTELILASATVHDLGFLAGQENLRLLIVDDCPALVDLSALAGLPLEVLSLTASGPDVGLRPLAGLSRLGLLTLRGRGGTVWSPEDLPAGSLNGLWLEGGMRPANGLRGLAGLHALRSLGLNSASNPASAEDWEELGRMPALRDLALNASSLETLPPTAVLADVASLTLLGGGGERALQAAVHRLPEAFPSLADCTLTGDMSAEGDIDLAPLAALPGLRLVSVTAGRDRVRGAAELPSSVTLLST